MGNLSLLVLTSALIEATGSQHVKDVRSPTEVFIEVHEVEHQQACTAAILTSAKVIRLVWFVCLSKC